MTLATPGVSYIARGLVNFLIPAAGVYGGLHILSDVLGLPIPTLTKLIAALCASPAPSFTKGIYERVQQRRQAKAWGAVPVPVIKGKWPGNFDVLLNMKRAFEEGYPGASNCFRVVSTQI